MKQLQSYKNKEHLTRVKSLFSHKTQRYSNTHLLNTPLLISAFICHKCNECISHSISATKENTQINLT